MNVLTNQRSVFTYLSSTPVAMLSSLMFLSISLDLSSSSPNMNLNQSEISRARYGPISIPERINSEPALKSFSGSFKTTFHW